ncbi:hypothetical protein [Streptomyces lunaelactis]|uniref:hypothetical protein n=1 Tax=Streptomyces lunaelactis TaxID=1535768 RepID=UPI001584993F|nr:hypothetical protein [Streptomyces lunaelactis]NUK85227.1 hypothetical protein [Streptomyces lunaelactis]
MARNGLDGRGGMGEFERRLLLAVDAEGYGRADVVTQGEFQEAITRLLGEAADAARLDRKGWKTQEGGDSVFAVLPAEASEPVLVDAFMRSLDAGLRVFNHNRNRQARLRLRAAVHFGPASLGANGFVGPAPVEIGRIRDSAALRTALKEASEACLAVGVSATVFRDVVRGEVYTTLRTDEFRQAWVEEKEYQGEAWIWVPGAGARQLDLEPDRQATTTGADGLEADGEYRGAVEGPRRPEGPAVLTDEVFEGGQRHATVVRGNVDVDEVAGDAVGVRTDRMAGSFEGTVKAVRVEAGGTVLGVDVRAAGGEK